ncbi:hypothetical protein GCM10018987_43590 [Streptomyces cremeus]
MAGVARRRLDAELVRRKLARSREHASQLIAAGRVTVGRTVATKAATQVETAAALVVRQDDDDPDYVSRGGHKLAGALAAFTPLGLEVAGRRALDAGASTGGFTDVLLRAGVGHVVAVDVGYGQLAWSLQSDERVTVKDRTNVREMTPETIDGVPVDLVVGDLSFIPLGLVLPALARCAAPDADLVLMVKPQFEVGKERLGSGGGGAQRGAARRCRTERGAAGVGTRARGAGRDGQSAARPLGERRVLSVAEGRSTRARPGGCRSCSGGGAPVTTTGTTGTSDGPDPVRAPEPEPEQVLEPARVLEPTAERTVFLLAHTGRPAAVRSAELVVKGLLRSGLGVRLLESEAVDLPLPSSVETVVEATPDVLDGCELLIVLGGDGTLLRGADIARASGVPMLGVNLGRVGFLAEAERDDLDKVVDRVVTRSYEVEERMTLDVLVHNNGEVVHEDWALNEAAVQKISPERMLEVVLEIDGRPVTGFGCDGIVCATPTGSTAYAFSAGGPVVWPEVEALLMVPISAHALFAKPLVTSPSSVLAVEVQPHTPDGVLWCDGRRTVGLPSGARVEVRRGAVPVRLARLHQASFTDRLVAKFALPVAGWRGAPH